MLAIIPARSGSKGIPNKNLVDLCGHPLIYYTIKAALNSKKIDQVFLSSDSDEIIQYGQSLGLTVDYNRPPELATDTASGTDVILDAIHHLKNDIDQHQSIIVLQPTSPLRNWMQEFWQQGSPFLKIRPICATFFKNARSEELFDSP